MVVFFIYLLFLHYYTLNIDLPQSVLLVFALYPVLQLHVLLPEPVHPELVTCVEQWVPRVHAPSNTRSVDEKVLVTYHVSHQFVLRQRHVLWLSIYYRLSPNNVVLCNSNLT